MRTCRAIYVVYCSVSVFSSASSLGVRYDSILPPVLICACSHASCRQTCYSAAIYILLCSIMRAVSSDVGLLRVIICCVCSCASIYQMLSFSAVPCVELSEIWSAACYALLYSTNVFCVPMRGLVNTMFCLAFSYVDSSCVYIYQTCIISCVYCSVLALVMCVIIDP